MITYLQSRGQSGYRDVSWLTNSYSECWTRTSSLSLSQRGMKKPLVWAQVCTFCVFQMDLSWQFRLLLQKLKAGEQRNTQTHTSQHMCVKTFGLLGKGALQQSRAQPPTHTHVQTHTCNGGQRESGIGFSAKWQMWRQAVQSGRNTQRLLQLKTWSDIHCG